MKQIILNITFLLLVISVNAQDSIVGYLNSVKKNFATEKWLINDSVLMESDIVFIGETHGFKDNYKVGLRLIEEYKIRTDFTYILAEM